MGQLLSPAVSPPLSGRPKRGPIRALVAAMRPRQWTKNVVVLAALVLSLQLLDGERLARAVAALLIFCAVSSAVYLTNDLLDIESDRRHPEKRHRPLAAGELAPRWAIVAALALIAVALVAAGFLVATPGEVRSSPMLLVAVVGYLLLQLAYSFRLKHMVIVEALSIAGGFVLRVLAGGAAIDTAISPWLYLSMIFVALFQAFGKRYDELRVLADAAAGHRRSLEHYTAPLLEQFITLSATATIVTYSMYAITTPWRPEGISANAMLLTVPFVIYAILRYLYLVQVRGMGGAPEVVLLRDRLMLLAVLGWGLTLLLILYLWPLLTELPILPVPPLPGSFVPPARLFV